MRKRRQYTKNVSSFDSDKTSFYGKSLLLGYRCRDLDWNFGYPRTVKVGTMVKTKKRLETGRGVFEGCHQSPPKSSQERRCRERQAWREGHEELALCHIRSRWDGFRWFLGSERCRPKKTPVFSYAHGVVCSFRKKISWYYLRTSIHAWGDSRACLCWVYPSF